MVARTLLRTKDTNLYSCGNPAQKVSCYGVAGFPRCVDPKRVLMVGKA
jgi:hypothetical protein